MMADVELEEKIRELEAKIKELGGGKISPELLTYIFEPSDERLPELTDLPLNQMNTMSWTVVYNEQAKMMARAIQYAIDKQNGGNPEKPELVLLNEVYLKAYYQHRRSLEGSGKMMASTLAMKQLEMQQQVEEGKVEEW